MIERLEDPGVIMIAAHRGYKSAYPENTLLAFRKALELEVDMLEFDLHLSLDGQVVVIHDSTLDRTTDGTGPVSSLSLSELKQLDAGGWFGEEFQGQGLAIPTLSELCELLRDNSEVLLNVEIKPAPNAIETADKAINVLGEFGYLQRCVFTSFDARVLAHIHDTHSLKTQGFPGEKMSNFISGAGGTYSKMWAIALEMGLLAPDRVAEHREMGLLVWSYCPDHEEQVKHCLDCGVTGMTCNDPLPALSLIRGKEAQK